MPHSAVARPTSVHLPSCGLRSFCEIDLTYSLVYANRRHVARRRDLSVSTSSRYIFSFISSPFIDFKFLDFILQAKSGAVYSIQLIIFTYSMLFYFSHI